MIATVCRENKPHKWVDENYTPYDKSGKVELMSIEDLNELISSSGRADFLYSSRLQKLLNEVYINQSRASYISGCGLFWSSYWDILEEKFEEWLYNSYIFFDEDDEYLEGMEDFELECKDVLMDVIETTSIDIYLQMIKRNITNY
ncbi:hypothetical protein DA411_00120 [Clostridioides difficile]|uniref:hypothetical protein n=1 Tax=Clostridioides difficile TaxID=1496 RepID=UPI00112C94CE|nr:hypothetical protein [Clostridioides difficile]TPF51009.1 hypothetical protein DA411_00120 [Clostridioides difficile]